MRRDGVGSGSLVLARAPVPSSSVHGPASYGNINLTNRNTKIRVAQRKRGGPITHRSQDRNLALTISAGFPHNFFEHTLSP
jgi:hypothetical protein